MDIGSSSHFGGGLRIFSGGSIRNSDPAGGSETIPRGIESARIIAGKVTFAATSQSGAGNNQCILGARSDASTFEGTEADDFYNWRKIEVTGGAGVGQQRRILDYVNSSRTITVEGRWAI
jgi:hypothetical protein